MMASRAPASAGSVRCSAAWRHSRTEARRIVIFLKGALSVTEGVLQAAELDGRALESPAVRQAPSSRAPALQWLSFRVRQKPVSDQAHSRPSARWVGRRATLPALLGLCRRWGAVATVMGGPAGFVLAAAEALLAPAIRRHAAALLAPRRRSSPPTLHRCTRRHGRCSACGSSCGRRAHHCSAA